MDGFLCYEFGELIIILKGLYMEGLHVFSELYVTYESCSAPGRHLFFLACPIGSPSLSTIKSSTSEQRS